LESETAEERHGESQLILEKMGDLAPAWGMIGTLIGLVIMLLNLDDPSSIGPSMAVALLTTFYGALWANFILLPAATKLEQRTKREMLNNNLIIEALVSVASDENPRMIQEKLLGVLPPKDRQAVIKKSPKAGKKKAG
jgi:chemotaxis protein MotA